MATVNVPRTELARLAGASPDCSDEELQGAIGRKLAAIDAEKQFQRVSAAEARLQDEDRRIVAAAINEGRTVLSRRDFWLEALKRDREVNRAVLASLAPGVLPKQQVAVDADVERVHDKVLARLGIPTAKLAEPTRTVAAAGAASAEQRLSGATMNSAIPLVDGIGIPIPPVPTPQRLVRGKDPATWTKQERDDAALWALGPQFRRGLRPPPGGDGYYRPSPNDVSTYDEASGEWRSKDGWERGTHGIGI